MSCKTYCQHMPSPIEDSRLSREPPSANLIAKGAARAKAYEIRSISSSAVTPCAAMSHPDSCSVWNTPRSMIVFIA
jgi:hypothetical protein